jgi:two-component system phosphate regulon sensor histidine kinase PhoR
MRIRLQLLLPILFGLLVAGGFLVAGSLVGAGVREALITIPGLTRDRAVEAAARAVGIGGVVATVLAVVAGVIVARMIVGPLGRMQRAAARLVEQDADPDQDTPVAEIQDVARGISVAAGELRDRQGRELRERSELAALVEAVSEGIVQVDGEGRIARLNRSARELLGLPADAAGRPVAALFRNPSLREIMERGAAGQGTDSAEVVLDDRRVLVTASAQPEGGAVATFVDLTDLRRLEEVRRDFVANASHELKTPLTSIRGYTETLLSGDLPDAERQQFLATISRNAERLQRIVDDLLDLSRLEAGRWQPDLTPVAVIQAAEACWLGVADRAADQGVAFHATHDGPDTGIADRRGLEQVFANLYDNALRYTPPDGRITVRSRVEPAPPTSRNGGRRTPVVATTHDGAWLVVEVADTGAGIPRDALPRIFERFYRVDPARSRAEGGTGLGLSIVKHMIESMGGGVEAESNLGKGTTIRVWLPAPG